MGICLFYCSNLYSQNRKPFWEIDSVFFTWGKDYYAELLMLNNNNKTYILSIREFLVFYQSSGNFFVKNDTLYLDCVRNCNFNKFLKPFIVENIVAGLKLTKVIFSCSNSMDTLLNYDYEINEFYDSARGHKIRILKVYRSGSFCFEKEILDSNSNYISVMIPYTMEHPEYNNYDLVKLKCFEDSIILGGKRCDYNEWRLAPTRKKKKLLDLF